MDNKYLQNLLEMLKDHYKNEILQNGKSDIICEDDYSIETEKFNQGIVEAIFNTPPTSYVKSINVYMDESHNILKIEYSYCDFFECINSIAINLFWE